MLEPLRSGKLMSSAAATVAALDLWQFPFIVENKMPPIEVVETDHSGCSFYLKFALNCVSLLIHYSP